MSPAVKAYATSRRKMSIWSDIEERIDAQEVRVEERKKLLAMLIQDIAVAENADSQLSDRITILADQLEQAKTQVIGRLRR